MAEAVRSGTKFREEFMKQQIRLRQAQSQKDRMIEVSRNGALLVPS